MESGSASGTGGQREAGKPRLVSLTVHELPGRNIDPCALRFSDGFNVLLGLNATGKTTLLEIITAALSFNFSKFKDEVFSVGYELQFPQGLIQAKVRNARPAQPHPRMMRGRQGSESLEYSVSLHVRTESPSLEWDIQANASALRVQAVRGSNMTAPFPSASLFRSDFLLHALGLMAATNPSSFNPVPIFVSAVLSWSVLQRFDESLGFFNAITADAAWVEATRPHGSTAEPELTDVGLVPGDLCDEIIRQCAHRAFGDDGDSLSISHQHIRFLAKAAEILDLRPYAPR